LNLLTQAFSEKEVFAASIVQASTVGAALIVIHHWNTCPMNDGIICFTKYSAPKD